MGEVSTSPIHIHTQKENSLMIGALLNTSSYLCVKLLIITGNKSNNKRNFAIIL